MKGTFITDEEMMDIAHKAMHKYMPNIEKDEHLFFIIGLFLSCVMAEIFDDKNSIEINSDKVATIVKKVINETLK